MRGQPAVVVAAAIAEPMPGGGEADAGHDHDVGHDRRRRRSCRCRIRRRTVGVAAVPAAEFHRRGLAPCIRQRQRQIGEARRRRRARGAALNSERKGQYRPRQAGSSSATARTSATARASLAAFAAGPAAKRLALGQQALAHGLPGDGRVGRKEASAGAAVTMRKLMRATSDSRSRSSICAGFALAPRRRGRAVAALALAAAGALAAPRIDPAQGSASTLARCPRRLAQERPRPPRRAARAGRRRAQSAGDVGRLLGARQPASARRSRPS